MVNFDVAVGGTQDVFNSVLQQIYPVLQKAGLLTFTVNVNQLNVKSATIDIQQAPTVDFKVILHTSSRDPFTYALSVATSRSSPPALQ
jgi:hypothetical protein